VTGVQTCALPIAVGADQHGEPDRQERLGDGDERITVDGTVERRRDGAFDGVLDGHAGAVGGSTADRLEGCRDRLDREQLLGACENSCRLFGERSLRAEERDAYHDRKARRWRRCSLPQPVTRLAPVCHAVHVTAESGTHITWNGVADITGTAPETVGTDVPRPGREGPCPDPPNR